MTTTRTLPLWIWIYAIGVMIIFSLSFSIALIVIPGDVFPELAGKNILEEPAKIFVYMNLVNVFATAFALYRRSASMIMLLFMIRLLTDLVDYSLSIILARDYLFPFVFFLLFVFWLPSAWGIRTLWSSREKRNY